jgi:pyridoxine 5-phosphate synthase
MINDPDPLDALPIVQRAGADQITIHLREDRRHINDMDAVQIIQSSKLPVNIECSINEEIIDIICELKPHRATIVPENREEVTTEGGLDLLKNYDRLHAVSNQLKKHEIEFSLFIDPTIEAIRGAKGLFADTVELHTGQYANIYAMLYSNLSKTPNSIKELELDRSKLQKMLNEEIQKIQQAAIEAEDFGIKAAAGHGLNYQNVHAIASIKEIFELNIGQSIIARSVFTGLETAIKDMLSAINQK